MSLVVVTEKPMPYRCALCGKRFYEHERQGFERHVIACSFEEAGEQMEKKLPSNALPGFYGDKRGDIELEDWVAKNRGLILEGRRTY